jgi:hypothetical protein
MEMEMEMEQRNGDLTVRSNGNSWYWFAPVKAWSVKSNKQCEERKSRSCAAHLADRNLTANRDFKTLRFLKLRSAKTLDETLDASSSNPRSDSLRPNSYATGFTSKLVSAKPLGSILSFSQTMGSLSTVYLWSCRNTGILGSLVWTLEFDPPPSMPPHDLSVKQPPRTSIHRKDCSAHIHMGAPGIWDFWGGRSSQPPGTSPKKKSRGRKN